MGWQIDRLSPDAIGISASRRTDIPALFAPWFEHRLAAGFAETIPAGPPRRVRRSLRPEDVTHFVFWSKWPRPLFRALDTIEAVGYPVLWNVTITGLGGTAVEPRVPPPDEVVAAVHQLAQRHGPAAILWRYDPVFVSEHYAGDHHRETFTRLCGQLVGHVDRVTCSLVHTYGRRVKPDLRAYERETGDRWIEQGHAEQVALLGRLREIAAAAGLPFTLCCLPEVQAELACEPAGCNRWAWASRVYPELEKLRARRDKPTRKGCACSQEVDIGVYDTCTHGCRYSYGSRACGAAEHAMARHDPTAPCLLPG